MGSIPPLVEPIDALGEEQFERVSRTIALPGLGVLGQARIAAARVLVIGAGGLGSPVLQYLAAAGVGTIGIVDFDRVDTSNLQRQVIHSTASIGQLKTASAAAAIAAIDPAITVIEHPVRLTAENALAIARNYDLIVDGSDNFATRYLANDVAALRGIPYVWGSVLRYDAQVTVFWEGAPDGRSLDYRDLHPVAPDPDGVLSCAEAGVLGSVCGTIGSVMATEALKLITGVGEPLLGRVQTLDALTGEWREFPLRRSPARTPVRGLIDYEEFCGLPPAAEPRHLITAAELAALEDVTLLDVREPYEHERDHLEGDRLIPLAELLAEPLRAVPPPAAGDRAAPLVVYCAVGARSARAVEALRAAGVDAVSLEGGLAAWRAAYPREGSAAGEGG